MVPASTQNGRATPEDTAISYSVQDGVATIELNRHELADAIDRAGRDASVGCVLLAGAGRAFSAGADLKQKRATTPWDEPDLRVALQRLFNRQLLPQLAAQLDAETEAQYLRGLSPEYAEGVAAFVEKRPADFRAAP